MAFNENTRVKIPAILHLYRLGYDYISLSNSKRDESTNIFVDIFKDSLTRINPDIDPGDIKKTFENISLSLDNEDLGQAFYNMLTASSGIKLIDFNNFENNSFHVVTELTCKNGDEEFRPDITLLINGMPLAFIEVKKPNNQEGVLAERNRINTRFQNKKFRKFINISQVLVFSNNMEYDSESIEPIQGAFYASSSYQNANFNCFREEEKIDLSKILRNEDDSLENFVLKDNNLSAIKHSPEFITNKETNTPTNRILTSLFSKERLAMLLKYSIAYVQTETGIEKHIMRYPQIFATKAIEKTIESGKKKGIIWHTQGSGKTALAFYNVQYLTDYFHQKGTVPKFYFIVDRIDLMNQAHREFTSRGLVVHTVNSKEDLLKDFSVRKAIHNLSGKREITVVNIQKFKDESDLLKTGDYDLNIQRVYFLDEVHRSYNPTGSFLANLVNSDRNAIIIGLTGTPLIGNERRSNYGKYFENLGKVVFAVFDKQKPEALKKINASVKYPYESQYKGFEELLIEETDDGVLKQYYELLIAENNWPTHLNKDKPADKNNITEIKKALKIYLEGKKTDNDSAELIGMCKKTKQIPETIRTVLKSIKAILEPPITENPIE